MGLVLSVFPETLTVCRLAPDADVPAWATAGGFWAVTRTPEELSVVAARHLVPPGVRSEGAWRAFKVEGPIPFSAVGILASLADPLARAGVSVFAISTFDTDYLLVEAERLEAARVALSEAGHAIR
jgi:uncharacterized protein